jgi:hypothetical protein
MSDKAVMVKVAFFKGKGTLFDRIVRFITRSRYSRVAVIVGHPLASGWVSYSVDRSKGVNRLISYFDAGEWDIIELDDTSKRSIEIWFKPRIGMPPNLLLELRLPFVPHGEDIGRYTSAEAVAAALGFPCPEHFTPGKLYSQLSWDYVYSAP